jgi:adenosylcobinamide kinase/adenosylcobinamide-phosphate guanylyltransferase
MSATIFITGGARSGKSRLAEKMALGYGAPLGYIATGIAGDLEMAERIARHRSRRGAAWTTLEVQKDLVAVIRANEEHCKALLVDCVTLWLTNLLLKFGAAAPALEEVKVLAGLMPDLKIPLILVSNEVGMGIVPENALARSFRDLAGEANELLAAVADEVYVMFSGLPLKLK